MNSNFPVPVIKGPGFILRPFASGDEVSLQASLNDPRVAKKVSNIPYPYTPEHARSWVDKAERYVVPLSKRVDFVIDIDGRVAGSMSFINLDGHKAQVSYWLAPDCWGKGTATEALKLLVKFGFETLGLVRIYGYAYAGNEGSMKVLARAGFQFESVSRKEWRKVIDGEEKYFDSYHYAIVAEG